MDNSVEEGWREPTNLARRSKGPPANAAGYDFYGTRLPLTCSQTQPHVGNGCLATIYRRNATPLKQYSFYCHFGRPPHATLR